MNEQAASSLSSSRSPLSSPPLACPRVEVAHGKAIITLALLPEVIPACEDQATSMGVDLAVWLEMTVNDVLRSYLGG